MPMETARQPNLLVALDGSERSLNTMRYLSQMPHFQIARLHLFVVISGMPECYWDFAPEPALLFSDAHVQAWAAEEKKAIEAHLDHCRTILLEAGYDAARITATMHLRQRGVARDVIDEARRGYEAVLIRRRGMTRIAGLVMGSVSQKLLGALHFVPLILCGLKTQNNRYLVAYDGSEAAERAVDLAARLLDPSQSTIRLLFVERSDAMFESSPDLQALHQRMTSKREGAIQASLQAAGERLAAAGFLPERISHKMVKGAISRANTIVDEAYIGDYATIILGRKGRSKVEDFSIGRVVTKVVHLANTHTVWVVN
jgi:nucleotide-binding universal stress UspA family protein